MIAVTFTTYFAYNPDHKNAISWLVLALEDFDREIQAAGFRPRSIAVRSASPWQGILEAKATPNKEKTQ